MDLMDDCKISHLEVHCLGRILYEMELQKAIELRFSGDPRRPLGTLGPLLRFTIDDNGSTCKAMVSLVARARRLLPRVVVGAQGYCHSWRPLARVDAVGRCCFSGLSAWNNVPQWPTACHSVRRRATLSHIVLWGATVPPSGAYWPRERCFGPVITVVGVGWLIAATMNQFRPRSHSIFFLYMQVLSQSSQDWPPMVPHR